MGVDAGATKVEACALSRDGRTVKFTIRRPGNPLAVGMERAVGAVVEATRGALSSLGVERKAEVLFICAAGAGSEETRTALAEALSREGLAEKVLCHHDAYGAWAGAFGLRPGVVVCAGTGAIAFGVDEEGREWRADGWGPVLGDEGSAHFVAVEGLKAAARAFDGRGPETAVLPLALERLGLDNFRTLVEWSRSASPAEIARLSEAVIEAAKGGDAVAKLILAEAGRRLALSASAVVGRFRGPKVKVALLGGLVEGAGELLSKPFKAALESLVRDKSLSFVEPLHPPSVGAALLAAREAWGGEGPVTISQIPRSDSKGSYGPQDRENPSPNPASGRFLTPRSKSRGRFQ